MDRERRTDRNIKKGKKRKSAKYKRVRAFLFLVMTAALVCMLFTGRTAADFDRASMKECGDPEAEVPEIFAEGAELYSSDLEEAVYSKNADKKLPPYSITKILTCYLAIKELDPDQVVTVSAYAATPLEDGTTIYLKEGEKISVRDLLYGAMLESGNDAATALAEAVSGSEKEFADLMNEQAAEWGCENTHFVNANGWEDKDHYTTAHDMAVITSKCFESKELRKIAMTVEYEIPATNMSEARDLVSHTLTGRKTLDEHVTGGKTGAWSDTDASLAVAFSKDGINGSAVVLRSLLSERKTNVNKLIAASQDLTPGYLVCSEGDIICEARVRGGRKTITKLCSADTVHAYPKGHERSGIEVELDRAELEAPLKAGEEAGTFIVYADGKKVQTGTLLTTEDIGKGWLPSRIYIPDRTVVLMAAAIVLWLLLLTVLRRIL